MVDIRKVCNLEDIKIGGRLRSLRKARRISLKKMADDLGMSYSYLSGLENNKHSITIVNLQKISAYFDVDMVYFFAEPETSANIRFIGREDRIRYITDDGLVFTNLTAGHSRNLEIQRIMHPPYSPAERRVYSHKHGEEEFITVLEGCLYVQVAGKIHELKEGESILFDAKLDHSIYTEQEAADFLLISSPPYNVTFL